MMESNKQESKAVKADRVEVRAFIITSCIDSVLEHVSKL